MDKNVQTITFSPRRLVQLLIVPLLIGVLVACGSETPSGPEIRAEAVWSRPAMAGMAMGEKTDQSPASEMGTDHDKATSAVYLKLVNTGRQADRLVSAQADVAEVVEIHESRMEGDVMMMYPLPDGLEIPAGGAVELKPGGYHLMLIGLKGDLQVGERFPVVLAFEKSGALTVEAQVREP